MKITAKHIGEQVEAAPERLGLTLRDLAITLGTRLQFIRDLEKEKPTCQIGKVLTGLNTRGMGTQLITPAP